MPNPIVINGKTYTSHRQQDKHKTEPIVIEIERKTFQCEIKSIDKKQGKITGYLAIFGNVDSQGDRIVSGAFRKTISDAYSRKANKSRKYLLPLLWMHNPEQPIGGYTELQEDQKGLYFEAEIDVTENEQGIPLNPLAMMAFSGCEKGYASEQSIGYKAIQKDYDKAGIRELKEIQLWEGSLITENFASNSETEITTVKARNDLMDIKAGSFPLADKTTPWSKSKAIKDIETATGRDWSKASKYFFWSAPNPTTEADHKFPFVANIGGTMKAVPRAIFNAAARLSGAKGVDTASVQAAMEPYYSKLGMTAPWKTASTDKEKSSMPDQIQYKDFNDRYREERIKDWKSTDFCNLVVALQSAIMDIFAIGDEPQMDVLNTILNGSNEGGESGNKVGFVQALQDYVQKGIDLDVSNYMDDNPYWGSVYSSSYGYMSRNDKIEGKAGAVVSQSNADRLKGHVDTLMQTKDMINTVADDITHYITGGQDAYGSDGKSNLNQTQPNQEPSKAHEPRQALKSNQPSENTDDFLTMLNSFLETQIPQKAA